MQLKHVVDTLSALRFMVEDLQLLSGPGRRVLMETPWMKNPEELQRSVDALALYRAALANEAVTGAMQLLEIKLAVLRDIKGTIKQLHGGAVLDDVAWFELKSFALLVMEIGELLPQCGLASKEGGHVLPDLVPLVRLLDPEGLNIPSFYIYDAYSAGLAQLRKQMRIKPEGAEREDLRQRANELEDKIRHELSAKARNYVSDLNTALHETGQIDILLAKARQSIAWNLSLPRIASVGEQTLYKGLFHPEIAQRLTQAGGRFQAIDFLYNQDTTLITGTNMGGKTVLLHVLALAQYLFQYGFAVPAQWAQIAPVDKVALCISEGESLQKGLSSFAAEILRINDIISTLRTGVKLLIIIDEPAQTTNPAEGAALVSGLVSLLCQMNARAIITTHYSGIQGDCRRMRVKGFTGGGEIQSLTPATIGQYMDYSLIEESQTQAPHEALKIAKLLGVDAEWVELSIRN